MPNIAPYYFSPEYPVADALALVQRIKREPAKLSHVKHLCGCIGCVIEKHDEEEDLPPAFGAAAVEVDEAEVAAAESMAAAGDVNGLCDVVETQLNGFGAADDETPAAMPPIVRFALRALLSLLLANLGDKAK